MAYQKILVTLDGSKLAEQALQHAVHIAAPGAYIHILSVVAPGSTSEMAAFASAVSQSPTGTNQWPQIEGTQDPREADARQSYLEKTREWLEPAGYSVTTETLTGSVIDSILDVADRGFDVIVMATHGRTGISKVVLGSVVEAVLQAAPCPVLVVSAHAAQAGKA
ncbi:MAG: universal stress protein [Chloroflexota bacterium]